MNSYHERVWTYSVEEAERAVMRLMPNIPGGKSPLETVEAYSAKVRKMQDDALAELAEARKQLAATKSIPAGHTSKGTTP